MFAALMACGAALSPIAVNAQSSASVQEGPVELEDSLFLQDAHVKNARGEEIPGGLDVVWIPDPVQKYCMGKTSQECATIDLCNRTTTKTVKMCQNLPANLRHLPPYPPGMVPNRQFSIYFSHLAPNINGFDTLRNYFDSAPKGSLDRLSEQAKFKARVQFTRTATDGKFELLEVLSVPSM